MDIQDDKDFAALPEVAKLYQACKERDLTIAEREYLKGARDAWQAKAQAVPEWINVNLLSPQVDTEVLVCVGDDVKTAIYRDLDGEGYFEGVFGAKWWMPKPKAQEQAND